MAPEFDRKTQACVLALSTGTAESPRTRRSACADQSALRLALLSPSSPAAPKNHRSSSPPLLDLFLFCLLFCCFFFIRSEPAHSTALPAIALFLAPPAHFTLAPP